MKSNFNLLIKIFIAINILSLLSAPLSAQDLINPNNVNFKIYYVSSSEGEDSWSGLAPAWDGKDGPKKTIRAAWQLFYNTQVARSKAMRQSRFKSGDQLLFKRGDQWIEDLSDIPTAVFPIAGKQGTQTNPVIIGAYGSGDQPLISVRTQNKAAIFSIWSMDENSQRAEWIRIQDLHLTSHGEAGFRPMGFKISDKPDQSPRNITVSNVVVNKLRYGFTIRNSVSFTLENSVVNENFAIRPQESGHSQGFYANHVNGLNLRNNTFQQNGRQKSKYDHDNYISNCENVLLEGNTHLNSNSAVKIRKGRNITIRGNTFINNRHSVIAGGDSQKGVVGNVQGLIFENNLIKNSANGLKLKAQSGQPAGPAIISDVIIRNNIFTASGHTFKFRKASLTLGSTNSLKNIYIYNNLFHDTADNNYTNAYSYQLASYESDEKTTRENIQIKNNIFFDSSNTSYVMLLEKRKRAADFVTDSSVIQFDNNLFYVTDNKNLFLVGPRHSRDGAFKSLDDFRAAYPNQSGSSTYGMPVFVDASSEDFRVTEESVATRDKGAPAKGIVDDDFTGNPRPSGTGWDIGPFEFGDN